LNKDCDTLDNDSTSANSAGNADRIKLRTLSETQLKQALQDHHKWTISVGGEGQIADLSNTDLAGAALKHSVLGCRDPI
jgi:hypothetical protein